MRAGGAAPRGKADRGEGSGRSTGPCCHHASREEEEEEGTHRIVNQGEKRQVRDYHALHRNTSDYGLR